MHDRGRGFAAVWLLFLAAAHAGAAVLVGRVFVGTVTGQALDTVALAGNWIGRHRIDDLFGVLTVVSVLALAAAIAVIGFIALVRRRIALAVVATLLIVGANVATQLLKYLIVRPDLGIDPARAAAGNSLPSGHTTVAAAVAVALVMVLPPALRGLGGLIGAGYAALTGVITLSAGWHRPSDAIVALLLVGAFAAMAGLLLVIVQPAGAVAHPTDAHPYAAGLLGVGGAVLLLVYGASLLLTRQVLDVPPDALGRSRLLVAYGGSAAGIAGTAALVMASVLTTLHRVVPRRPAEG